MRALLLLAGAAIQLGCATTIYTVGPRCPVWSEEAEAELALAAPQYPALEEAIGRQELWCQAHEPSDTSAQCFGWWCWWWRLWE